MRILTIRCGTALMGQPIDRQALCRCAGRSLDRPDTLPCCLRPEQRQTAREVLSKHGFDFTDRGNNPN